VFAHTITVVILGLLDEGSLRTSIVANQSPQTSRGRLFQKSGILSASKKMREGPQPSRLGANFPQRVFPKLKTDD